MEKDRSYMVKCSVFLVLMSLGFLRDALFADHKELCFLGTERGESER